MAIIECARSTRLTRMHSFLARSSESAEPTRLAGRPGYQAIRSSNWLAGSGLTSGSFSQIALASLAVFVALFMRSYKLRRDHLP
jgi:hypothetical protein